MNQTFTKYEVSTGKPVSVLSLPGSAEDIEANSGDGYALLLGTVDLRTEYVHPQTQQIMQRPQFGASADRGIITADGIDFTEIAMEGPAQYEIIGPVNATGDTGADTVLDFCTDVPGEYVITLHSWPCISTTITIIAVAP